MKYSKVIKIFDFFNFNDVGQKIKDLARWLCWISIILIWIAAPIAFIVLIADRLTAAYCWIPLVIAIAGPFLIWVGCWVVYAFGDIAQGVHNVDINTFTPTKKSAAQREEDKKRIAKLESFRAKGLITEEEFINAVKKMD